MKRDLQELVRAWARMGAKGRMTKITPERRQEIARHAVQVRWAKHRATKKTSAA